MSAPSQNAPPLAQALAAGWRHGPGALPQFLEEWRTRLKADVNVRKSAANALYFTSKIGSIHLRGMGNVHCLLLGGSDFREIEEVAEAFRTAAAPGRVAFILTASPHAHRRAAELAQETEPALLAASTLPSLLTSAEPRQAMLTALHGSFPLRMLNPYSILLSADENMFFGRSGELTRLLQMSTDSFAIAGPGRIGKTSLVKEYQRQRAKRDKPAGQPSQYLDFYECPDKTDDGIAQAIAKLVEDSSRSRRVTKADLINFLRFQAHSRLRETVDLVLDEVDEVCRNPIFEILVTAAKLGYCRLILCGRGSLLREMTNEKSLLAGRLELMRLPQLDEEAARELLVKPLSDMGLSIDAEDRFVDLMFRLTGRLPHLIQFYCRKLSETCVSTGRTVVSTADIETLRWDFEVAEFFTSPLMGLKDPCTRVIALLLLRSMSHQFSVAEVQRVGQGEGFGDLSFEETKAICDELVINNLLAWNAGNYVIANESLVYYARETGFLDTALSQARSQVPKSTPRGAPGG